MGNPFFFDCTEDSKDEGGLFRYLYLDKNIRKAEIYGRHGTYLNLRSHEKTFINNKMDNIYMHEFFADIGYILSTTSIYGENKDNCLMNVFRCNWSFVIAGALRFFWKYHSDPPNIGDTVSEVRKNISNFDYIQ
ncbi:MAG: hypothetical protein E7Y34_02855, partial [Mycoplasma sp.]|nr:hypothetical protein [Mycoplasma sp.]